MGFLGIREKGALPLHYVLCSVLVSMGIVKWGLRRACALPIFGTTKGSAFPTNAQSRFASVVLYGVLGPPRLAHHASWCPCISVVPEATHEASRGPLKGAVSAQKAVEGSETETRELLGGTEENSVSPIRGH